MTSVVAYEKQNIEVKEVAFHRNGVGGVGFYAVLFTWETGDGVQDFVGIVFDEPGMCAVVSLDLVNTCGVKFGENSWRGDVVEPQLREAIEVMGSSSSIRIGPFGLPAN